MICACIVSAQSDVKNIQIHVPMSVNCYARSIQESGLMQGIRQVYWFFIKQPWSDLTKDEMHSSFDCTLIQKNCIEPKLLTYCLLQTRTLPSNKNKQRLLEFSRSPEWAFFASGNNCCHAVQVAPPKFECQGVQIGMLRTWRTLTVPQKIDCLVKGLGPKAFIMSHTVLFIIL